MENILEVTGLNKKLSEFFPERCFICTAGWMHYRIHRKKRSGKNNHTQIYFRFSSQDIRQYQMVWNGSIYKCKRDKRTHRDRS